VKDQYMLDVRTIEAEDFPTIVEQVKSNISP
jgi:hypothetical protein